MVPLHYDGHASLLWRNVLSDGPLPSGGRAVMTLLFTLIVVQALLGAFDNLWHHEITERLPHKRAAARELALHAAREFLYAFLFFAFAWYEWRGVWAALIGTVFAVEVVITLADFIVEDQTRHLPKLERVLHTLLAMNVGAVLIILAPILIQWWSAQLQFGL